MAKFNDSAGSPAPTMQEAMGNADVGVSEVEEVPLEDIVPSNVHTLSTGIRIQFQGPMLETMRNSILTHTFVDANLDGEGQVRDDGSGEENIERAAAMLRYHGAILTALNDEFEPVVTMYDGLPDNASKLIGALKRDPLVRDKFPDIKWNDDGDRQFMYMMYFAFKSAADWALLSNEFVNSVE